MIMGKYCCYEKCKSDSRYHKNITFYPVPKPGKRNVNLELTQKWITSINRDTITASTLKKHHYVCNLHFIEKNGPTQENPYPSPFLPKELTPKPIEASVITAKDQQSFFQLEVNKSGTQNYSIETANDTILMFQDDSTIKIEPHSSTKSILNELSSSNDTTFKEEPQIMHNKANIQNESENFTNSVNQASESYEFQLNLKILKTRVLEYQETHEFSWAVSCETNKLTLCKKNENILTVRLEVSETMGLKIFVFYKEVDVNHKCLALHGCQITTFEKFIKLLDQFDSDWNPCWGLYEDIFVPYFHTNLRSAHYSPQSNSLRSDNCEFLTSKRNNYCQKCGLLRRILLKRVKRKKAGVISPKQTNIKNMNAHEVRVRYAALKVKNKALQRKNKLLLKKIYHSIEEAGAELTPEEGREMQEAIETNPFENPKTFQKFFLRQQLHWANSKSKRPKKWHSSLIHWCLYIKSKSPSTYETLRRTFTLPTRRTLCNYSKDLKQDSGFKKDTIQ